MDMNPVITIIIVVVLCMILSSSSRRKKAAGKTGGGAGTRRMQGSAGTGASGMQRAGGFQAGNAGMQRTGGFQAGNAGTQHFAGSQAETAAKAAAKSRGIRGSISPSSGIVDDSDDWFHKQLKEEAEAQQRISAMLGITKYGSDARKLKTEHEIIHEYERRRNIRR